MPLGLYIAADGAQAQSKRLETIANNLANVDTAGFKPDIATFQARYSEAIQQNQDFPGSQSINDIGGGVKVIQTQTNFAAGRIEHTGNDTDLAIIGEGFFQVQGGDGQQYLTRAGDMRLDNTGRLVTADGDRPVLSADGSSITLTPGVPWNISVDGFVQQNGEAAPLALVRPESLNELTKVGSNLFRPGGEVEPVAANQREVRQGYLEMSGSNSTRQMMSMIETSRAFEANAKMIQNQDQMVQNLVGRLLRA
ncbi:Flagellar basal-body rod protein FlgG [Pirellulimonas nuda]|uniref:Flagellar basal-body rod protein FlgG n=1 Tax=Pirellulimonas nuda TaxID=2528009 RepID=A0A518DFW4_9BACT|nr:flagellar basal-body rod protein FlgF [Pirellulimonas nuda]QDU90322.1 Flagellar basal-body rod protein FlgG [Pirellulimonas nuda]